MTCDNKKNKLQRMWINQPSKHQPLHDNHGTLVLADLDGDCNYVTVYFVHISPVISAFVPRICLSKGWSEYRMKAVFKNSDLENRMIKALSLAKNQMEQMERMFRDDDEFNLALRRVRNVLDQL